ncbi:MAG: HmuY family protein [Saprospiraceae bacterium]|nr:HmuY family protein [Saprospiraceae bacterium]
MKNVFYFIIVCCVSIFSCTEDDPVTPSVVTSVIVRELPADPYTGIDPVTMRPTGDKGVFTFYRLSDSSLVANSDSATTKWDIGFKGSTIITNGGSSGPGQGGALVIDGIFSELAEIPASSNFIVDNNPNFGVDRSWYKYDPSAMVFTPVPGKIILIRTADGKYAKLEVLSYYKGAPANPTVRDESRYYTFRYVYQPDGSRKF